MPITLAAESLVEIRNMRKRVIRIEDLMQRQLGNKGHMQAARVCAEEFVRRIKEAIDTQSFPGSYSPLTEKWEKRKAAKGGQPGFWRFMGGVYGGLGTRRVRSGWAGGLITSPGRYPAILEGLTGYKHARPLFDPIADQIIKDYAPLILKNLGSVAASLWVGKGWTGEIFRVQ